MRQLVLCGTSLLLPIYFNRSSPGGLRGRGWTDPIGRGRTGDRRRIGRLKSLRESGMCHWTDKTQRDRPHFPAQARLQVPQSFPARARLHAPFPSHRELPYCVPRSVFFYWTPLPGYCCHRSSSPAVCYALCPPNRVWGVG